MNDLYLIGNGFDLAHGLKTSNNDFLLWYLNKSIGEAEKGTFNDSLLEIIRISKFIFKEQKSISRLLSYSDEINLKINYKHPFLGNIVKNYHDYRWVDIEYEYYMALVRLYKRLEKAGVLKHEQIDKELESLNNCFDSIKKQLAEYLTTLEIPSKLVNTEIESILLEGTGPERNENGEKLFLYFNYTSTIELYARKYLFRKNNWIYIHGELRDNVNPIIFGYGDEMDTHYEKIENLNSNEFLKNIKSFSYFKTDNYQKVIRFVEQGDFTVKILGHSCGLSDRILLNTIFEHPNCKWIKIYYYEKSPTENDYFEKTQEISQHFKASMKGEMRKKIVPFDKYSKMPQNPKDN